MCQFLLAFFIASVIRARSIFALLVFVVLGMLTSGAAGAGQTPSGHGNWKLVVSYSGLAQTTYSPPNGSPYRSSVVGIPSQYYMNVSESGTPLDSLSNYFQPTYSGGISTGINAFAERVQAVFSGSSQQNGSATVYVTLYWQPKNFDWILDPPPACVKVYYRPYVSTGVTVSVTGQNQSASATASGQCGSASANCSRTISSPNNISGSGVSDPNAEFAGEILQVNNGIAIKSFSLQWNLNDQANGFQGGGQAAGHADVTAGVDFCLPGFDISRFGHGSGNRRHGASDPSFTRWLPLMYSPQISSQPFRTVPGPLPQPWGNATCAYTLELRKENTTPNLDINGTSLLYLPSPGSNGYNNPGPPFKLLPGSLVPQYALTDANGDRLIWDQNWTPARDIHSTLITPPPGAHTFYLTNAGPPGALKQRGHYTYTFQSPGELGTANLVSISDDLGNTQTLQWSTVDPFLTVVDSSTGPTDATRRKLRFYHGSNGYLGSVESSIPNSSAAYTRTVTTYDVSGHLTNIKVYFGNSQTPAHTDTFGYGGPNNDAIVSVRQGPRSESHTFVADPYFKDPFGLSVGRLGYTIYGDPGDLSSSDDGNGIAGEFDYSWGPLIAGYDSWGIDAHTNTFTDPRGNQRRSIMRLPCGNEGGFKGFRNSGPDYSGASINSNVSELSFVPDELDPDTILFSDPLTLLGARPAPMIFNFDPQTGVLTRVTDPLSNVWNLGYVAGTSDLSSLTDPTGITWSARYGENGAAASLLTSIVDPGGSVLETFTYNSYGQTTSDTIPAAVSATGTNEQAVFTYDPITGDPTRITDPLGNTMTVNAYDPLGDPLSFSLYPDTGNPVTSQTPLTTSLLYDAAQQIQQVTLPNGVQINTVWQNDILTQLLTHDPLGNLLSQLNLSFDSRGRLYRAGDSLGDLSQLRYDKNSNITQVWDGNGHITRFSYGANDEPTGYLWPDNHGGSFAYDAGGRMRQITDERGNIMQFQYDAVDNLYAVLFPNTPGQNVHGVYDAAGRLLNIQDASGSRIFVYDQVRKRLQSVVVTLNALPAGHNTFTISYTYNGDGSVASMTSPAGTTSYLYDANGQLTRLADPQGNVTVWTYDHAGNITGQNTFTTHNTAFNTAYHWGGSHQQNDPSTAPAYLDRITQTINGQPFWTYNLTRTYLGQMLSEQGTGVNETSSESFVYDGRGHLTSEAISYQANGQQIAQSQGNYTYDLASNLFGQPDANNNQWTVNPSNQITAAPATAGLAGATGLTYDVAGNVIGMNGQTLTYDCWNNLSGISNLATYTYNADGMRVSKTAGGVTTYYLYEGDQLIAELDNQGNVVRSFTWGAMGILSDHLGDITTGYTRFYSFDAQGNTRALLDADGNVLSRGVYSAWGKALVAPTTPFAWKGAFGQYTDNESGLVYLGARYYSPALGRFLSRDPSCFFGGLNLYAYCMGDPINYFDNDGGYVHIIIGACIGGVWGAWHVALHGGDSWQVCKGAFIGAASGAMGAATFGLVMPVAGGVLGCFGGALVAGAADGITSDLTSQGLEMMFGDRAKFDPNELAESGMMGALFAGLFEMVFPSGGCFVAGTPVATLTAKGQTVFKPIEQIKQGDNVLTRNPQTGQNEVQTVEKTSVRKVPQVLTISLANSVMGKTLETITTTREHPFYVEGRGFVPAGQLAIGNAIITRAGPPLVVQHIEWQHRSEGYSVYNFVVPGNHTYFVGNTNGGIWVHNPNCVQSFGAATYEDLTTDGIIRTSASLTGKSNGYVVYVVRDVRTGELLKVGQTMNKTGRFSKYYSRALSEGREIAIDAFEVNQRTARGMKPTLESQIQKYLWDQGHNLPWDESRIFRKLRAKGR